MKKYALPLRARLALVEIGADEMGGAVKLPSRLKILKLYVGGPLGSPSTGRPWPGSLQTILGAAGGRTTTGSRLGTLELPQTVRLSEMRAL